MNDPPAYPIFLNLAHQPVLVIGAGSVALRKTKSLLESAAAVTVISRDFTENFPPVEMIQSPYESAHMQLKPWRLAFAATNSPEVNAAIQQDAANNKIPCCRCDDPSEGDFTNAAVGRAGGITVAVSTAGSSPALAVRIRDTILRGIDPVLAELAALSADWRSQVRAKITNESARHELMRKLAAAEMENTLRSKGKAAAHELFATWLIEAQSPSAVNRG